MSKTNFHTLLGIVGPMITKLNTRFGESVPAEMKLAITLRYLATGASFMSLTYLFKVSKQFISSMLQGLLKVIIKSLQNYVNLSFLLLYFFNFTIFFTQWYTLRGNLHNIFYVQIYSLYIWTFQDLTPFLLSHF
jgi:hypothetical protein